MQGPGWSPKGSPELPARARSLRQGLPIACRAPGGRHPLLRLTARGAGAGREGERGASGGAEGVLALRRRRAEDDSPAVPGDRKSVV